MFCINKKIPLVCAAYITMYNCINNNVLKILLSYNKVMKEVDVSCCQFFLIIFINSFSHG